MARKIKRCPLRNNAPLSVLISRNLDAILRAVENVEVDAEELMGEGSRMAVDALSLSDCVREEIAEFRRLWQYDLGD